MDGDSDKTCDIVADIFAYFDKNQQHPEQGMYTTNFNEC